MTHGVPYKGRDVMSGPGIPQIVKRVELILQHDQGSLVVNNALCVVIPKYKDFLLVWTVAYLMLTDQECRKWGGVPAEKIHRFLEDHHLPVAPTISQTWDQSLWRAKESHCRRRFPLLRTMRGDQLNIRKEDENNFLRNRLFTRMKVPRGIGFHGSKKLYTVGRHYGQGADPEIDIHRASPPEIFAQPKVTTRIIPGRGRSSHKQRTRSYTIDLGTEYLPLSVCEVLPIVKTTCVRI